MKKIKPINNDFEQAKWLHGKGFDETCNKLHHFNGSDCISMINKNSENFGFSAPEQWQVVEWLRINHGIWVQVVSRNGMSKMRFEFEITRFEWYNYVSELTTYDSPQAAYSAAFDYIKNNNLI
jgi:hypothetical protein